MPYFHGRRELPKGFELDNENDRRWPNMAQTCFLLYNNMHIFCFDMLLIKLCLERYLSPSFLVHDSHLFDGVDERKIGKALQINASEAKKYKFQYIVAMDSDDLPKELPESFDLDEYILPVRLTDATGDGGLFEIGF